MDRFTQFWTAYPRRVGKGTARTAFQKALKKTDLETMLKALAWQCRQPSWTKDGGKYVPHPSTWLNQERWDDEPFHAIPDRRPAVQWKPGEERDLD